MGYKVRESQIKQNRKHLPPITANRKICTEKTGTTLDMLEIGETRSVGPDAKYKLAPEPWVTDAELWNLSAPSHVASVWSCLTFGGECLCHREPEACHLFVDLTGARS